MKKLTPWLTLALLFVLNSTLLKAENNNQPVLIDQANLETELAMVRSEEAVNTAYANALFDRLNEINEKDFSAMSASEKNDLRKEVRDIKKEQKTLDGVYISVGAAILIVILLILLL